MQKRRRGGSGRWREHCHFLRCVFGVVGTEALAGGREAADSLLASSVPI